jgi:hypothetical protein
MSMKAGRAELVSDLVEDPDDRDGVVGIQSLFSYPRFAHYVSAPPTEVDLPSRPLDDGLAPFEEPAESVITDHSFGSSPDPHGLAESSGVEDTRIIDLDLSWRTAGPVRTALPKKLPRPPSLFVPLVLLALLGLFGCATIVLATYDTARIASALEEVGQRVLEFFR